MNIFDMPYWKDLSRPLADLQALNEKIAEGEARGQFVGGLRTYRVNLINMIHAAQQRAQGHKVNMPKPRKGWS